MVTDTRKTIYKCYVRFALSGVIVMYFAEKSYKDFCAQIGKLHLSSIEHINRIDFEQVDSVPDGEHITHYYFMEDAG